MNNSEPYDLDLTLNENIVKGPPSIPYRIEVPDLKRSEWLGIPLQSLIGVSASPLTMNSEWVQWCSDLGYDVITYKTVRSDRWLGHHAPNWVHVDPDSFNEKENRIEGSLTPYEQSQISMANSFGIQSESSDIWMPDYEAAKSSLKDGQILILSVMHSVRDGVSIFDDMDQLAEHVNNTSADIVEVNFACPNSAHNLTYLDVDLTVELCKHFSERVRHDIKVLAKVGYYPDQNDLYRFVDEAKDYINGITSINTMSMNVVDAQGNPLFGPQRRTAGISGAIIKPYALHQMENLIKIRRNLGLEGNFGLGYAGGVSAVSDIERVLEMGSDIFVQAATGVWENPNLAIDWKNYLRD